ncbi:MAG: chemotaxis protein CheX [Phycisphaerales bacterium]|jgi:chemotaxis protein CheX
MDPALITPFIKSVQNVFATMLQLPVDVEEPTIKQGKSTTYDVSAIIGMSGDCVGSVVLSFEQESALRIVSLFTGTEVTADSPDFADAVGELVNMISGGAKALFVGRKASISTPSVVLGPSHVVSSQKDMPVIVLPCVTDCGRFAIEIAIQDQVESESTDQQAASANA